MTLDWLHPAAFFGSILFALIGVLVFWICLLYTSPSPRDS